MVRTVVSSPALPIYFRITCRSVVPFAHRTAHSQPYQIACPVIFEVCPLMVRVCTMLLVRKSRKLVAQYASERQCISICTGFSFTHRSYRDSDARLVDTVLRDLHRTRRTGTNGSQADYKVCRSKRPRQLCLLADVLLGLSI